MIALTLAVLSASMFGQPGITGLVRDSVTRAPLGQVVIVDLGTRRQVSTDARGGFVLDVPVPTRIRLTHPGYAARDLDVTSPSPVALTITLAPSPRALEAVTVTALRGSVGGGTAPISERTLDRAEIQQRSFGQDIPLLLQGTPSLTSYAETANYWGYSYIRLRGIDQSRINLTIDGIPLNDPEDQVLYFADFPDLASSIESVQIQRGVGTSSTGTAAYAGSINFETTPLAAAHDSGEIQLEGGSFDSRRGSASFRTGLLPSRFAFAGRVSALQTNGYRYHSGVLGRSVFLSGGYFGDRDIVKVMATAGLMSDTLSYLAVPDTALARDRRLNPLGPDELDRFGEQLVSAAYTRLLGGSASLSTTLYRISASGNYDVAIDPDLWNYHLDFVSYGLTSALTYQRDRLRLNVGVNGSDYARDHYAFIQPDLQQSVYFNTGRKHDASGFAKAWFDVGRATLFGDLQTRWAEWRYLPDRNAGIPSRAISWTFVNPRAGVAYHLSPAWQLYASYGRSSREPARNDMLAGFDNLDTSNVAFVGSLSRVRPETVHDVEAGTTLQTAAWQLQGNLFSMRFRNEIAPIGALSYQGLPLRKNVAASYRRGIELDAAYRGLPRVTLAANGTLMNARISAYTDDASGITYRGVEPLLTPKLVTSQRLELEATRAVRLALEGRYTGRSQLTNTGDPRLVLPASYVADGSVTWSRRAYGLVLRVNNIGNSKAFGSGYADGETPAYYVLPPRNVFVTVQLRF